MYILLIWSHGATIIRSCFESEDQKTSQSKEWIEAINMIDTEFRYCFTADNHYDYCY